MFSDHYKIRLEINNRKMTRKFKLVEITLLSNPWNKKKSQGNLKIF